MAAPIGVFDSGYGGLTILKALQKQLPEYVSSSDAIVNPQLSSNSGWYFPKQRITEDEYVLWHQLKKRM
jgi:hypothetical protein